MVDWYLVSVLIFTALLAVFVFLDRKKWKRESVLLLRKTQTGTNYYVPISSKGKG